MTPGRSLETTTNGGATFTTTYTAGGNIDSKTDAGSYSYHASKIHAVEGTTNPTTVIPSLQQDITYTAFLRPETVSEGDFGLTYSYGTNYNRTKSELNRTAEAAERQHHQYPLLLRCRF